MTHNARGSPFNDPINHTDPSGFSADVDAGGGIVGGIVGAGHAAVPALFAAGFGGNFGAAAVGGLASGGMNIGISQLLDPAFGNPFAGTASRSYTVAGATHAATSASSGPGATQQHGPVGPPLRDVNGVATARDWARTPPGLGLCDSGLCSAQRKSPRPMMTPTDPGGGGAFAPPPGAVEAELTLFRRLGDFFSSVVSRVGKFLSRGPKATRYAGKIGPGPHAVESVPASGPAARFTQIEREAVNELGYKYGCHSCGTFTPGTKSGNWIPDHQPPSAFNPSGQPQYLYPHCLQCSRIQGGEINSLK